MKKIFNVRFIMRFVLATFILSTAYVIVRIILAPAVAPPSDIMIRVKSDYTLMLLQCVVGVAALFLPHILYKRAGLAMPAAMLIAYALFLYCAIFHGEVRSFYYVFPHWDTILHTFSGAALGALGFSLISLLNGSESVTFRLSPVFVAIFAFCFAVSLGVIWEIYEFTMDYILGTNMQKFALESGEPLIGQEALADTMKDLIVDAIGALAVAVIGFISMKSRAGWLERVQLKREKQEG